MANPTLLSVSIPGFASQKLKVPWLFDQITLRRLMCRSFQYGWCETHSKRKSPGLRKNVLNTSSSGPAVRLEDSLHELIRTYQPCTAPMSGAAPRGFAQ